MSRDNPPRFHLQRAETVAQAITDRAVWDDDVCTWMVVTGVSYDIEPGDPLPVDDQGRRYRPEPTITTGQMGGTLYDGTAGVALFLAEYVARAETASKSATSKITDVTLGAIRHALREGDRMHPGNMGLFTGRTGVAVAAHRVAQALPASAAPWVQDHAASLVEPATNGPDAMLGFDVTNGDAGAVLGLLECAEAWHRPDLLTAAARFGDRIIERAHIDPDGWSWGPKRSPRARNLTGMAHGAAGMALALLELYRITSNEAYRYVAEQALRYEQTFYRASSDDEPAGWADLRHQHLRALAKRLSKEKLAAAFRNDKVSPFQPLYRCWWCHGAPGIALVRMRAAQILGSGRYRDQARAALAATAEGTSSVEGATLCHGTAGNVLAMRDVRAWLLSVAQTPTTVVSSDALHRLSQGVHVSTDTDTSPHASPGLMTGQAGIGWHHLRMHDPSVRSILCPGLPAEGSSTVQLKDFAFDAQKAFSRPDSERQVRIRERDRFFELSDRVIHRAVEWDLLPEAALSEISSAVERGSTPGQDATCLRYDSALQRLLSDLPPEIEERTVEYLRDATRVDRRRFRAWQRIQDFTAPFIRAVCRTPIDEVDIGQSRWVWHPEAACVRCRYDWPSWVTGQGTRGWPDEEAQGHVLYRTRREIQVETLAPPAFRLAEAVERAHHPLTTADLTTALQAGQKWEERERRETTHACIRELYDLGVLVLADEADLPIAPYRPDVSREYVESEVP